LKTDTHLSKYKGFFKFGSIGQTGVRNGWDRVTFLYIFHNFLVETIILLLLVVL
jgi:hypothetical protein